MKLFRELYYPTPIYYLDLDGADALNQFMLTRIYAWRDRDENGIVRSNQRNVGAWHSPTTMNALPEFDLFTQKIIQTMTGIYQDQQYDPDAGPVCFNMWANINPRGAYNRSHTHPGSLWSGVYYVQTPPDCGRVIFLDPRAQAEFALPRMAKDVKSQPMHWKEVHHNAVAGRLVVFPGWLRHEVEPNLCKLDAPYSDRISISFNFGQG